MHDFGCGGKGGIIYYNNNDLIYFVFSLTYLCCIWGTNKLVYDFGCDGKGRIIYYNSNDLILRLLILCNVFVVKVYCCIFGIWM